MEISKTGHNVATAIFQNGCQIQYPRILINTACRSIIVVCQFMFQETPDAHTPESVFAADSQKQNMVLLILNRGGFVSFISIVQRWLWVDSY